MYNEGDTVVLTPNGVSYMKQYYGNMLPDGVLYGKVTDIYFLDQQVIKVLWEGFKFLVAMYSSEIVLAEVPDYEIREIVYDI